MIVWENEHPLIHFREENQTYHLDVRPLLEEGGEPYPFIVACVHQIQAEDTLIIHSLFEPKPLLKVILDMGYQVLAERVGEDHWHTTVAAANR